MAKNNYLNVFLISWSGVIGWLINYIYHPIMIQFLSLSEFGTFASLLAILNILWVLITGLVLFLNREMSQNIEDKPRVKFIFLSSLKILFFVSFVIFVLFLLFSPLLAVFLKIDNLSYIFILSSIIWISFLSVSVESSLRAFKKFEFIALSGIIWPIIRVLVWFTLVFLWFKLYWAILWFVLSAFILFIVALIYVFSLFKNIESKSNYKQLLADFYRDKKSIISFFLVSLFFAIFMNIDLLLAKNIFTWEISGAYASLSVLAKFLIFLLLSIETVYYGQIMETKNINLNLIRNPLILMWIISVSAIVFNLFFWKYILYLLKPGLEEYFSVYILSLVYYSILVFVSFLSKILIWKNHFFINYILGFFVLLLLLLIYMFTSDLNNFITIFIVVLFSTFVVITFLFFKNILIKK